MASTVTVTVTLTGEAVTPASGVTRTVKLTVPVTPVREMREVDTELAVLSRSCGPLSTTLAGLTVSAAR
jgi:predicted MarR family transcription regulator